MHIYTHLYYDYYYYFYSMGQVGRFFFFYYQNCNIVWWPAGCYGVAGRLPPRTDCRPGRWPRPVRRPNTTRCLGTFAACCVGHLATVIASPVPWIGPGRRCRRRRRRILRDCLRRRRARTPPPASGRKRNGRRRRRPRTTSCWAPPTVWAKGTCRLSEPQPTRVLFCRFPQIAGETRVPKSNTPARRSDNNARGRR